MTPVFDSLVPVFLIIGLGWLLKTTQIVEERHWSGLERVTYLVFFPAVIVDTLTSADLSDVPVLGVAGALVSAILVVSVGLIAAQPVLSRFAGIDGPSFTSLFQGSTRWNTFVALAVAGSLYGARGLAVMAVAIAAMVPLLNVLAVSVLTRYAGGTRQGARRILASLAVNPFIWSCALGLILNAIDLTPPKTTATTLKIVGQASLAAGLLVVGAGLDLRRLIAPRFVHVLAIGLKLIVLPLVAIGAAFALGLEGPDLATAAIAASVPTAGASYVLAKQMNGNAALMAEIIVSQTLVALVTMPFIIGLVSKN